VCVYIYIYMLICNKDGAYSSSCAVHRVMGLIGKAPLLPNLAP